MSILIKAISIYEKYGYHVSTGLNPYHFGSKDQLKYPFTYLTKKDNLYELQTGGGLLLLRYIFLNVWDKYCL